MNTINKTEIRSVRATITGGFLHRYRKLIRDRTLPYQWQAMNDNIPGAPKSHSVENFRLAAGRASGTYEGMVFQDSDLYKWLEAVGQLLVDETLEESPIRAAALEAIDLIEAAQLSNGYLNTYFIVNGGERKWGNLRDAHELYCAGHFIEAAVALSRSGRLGDHGTRILNVARRLADHIDATFGTEAGKVPGIPGHEEVELALLKLARATGETRYRKLAGYFVDQRGTRPSYFTAEAQRGDFHSIYGPKPLEYYQAHRPVREQSSPVGHAVRAMYLYIAMADLALESGDSGLREACERLWTATVSRKMYITGSIGSSSIYEAFGADYDLPNDTAYAETCAAIGLFLFSARMLRIHDRGGYGDAMERCLYNGILSGISLDGTSYFYVNPLEVTPRICDENPSYQFVKYRRQPWYGCACCPPNIARTIAGVGDYTYHFRGNALYCDLYHTGTITQEIGGKTFHVAQKTDYPWSGTVTFSFDGAVPADFSLMLRIPHWAPSYHVTVNEAPVQTEPVDGYAPIRRKWRQGDIVVLNLAMEPSRVDGNPLVPADYGKVALSRGPLIYCLEEADNGSALYQVRFPAGSEVGTVSVPGLPDEVVGLRASGTKDGKTVPLIFVPYFSWANRSSGEMAVWLRS